METPVAPAEKKRAPRPNYLSIAMQFLQDQGTPVVHYGGYYWQHDGRCYKLVGSRDEMQMAICRWLGQDNRGCPNERKSFGELEFQLRSNTLLPKDQALPGWIGQEETHRLTLSVQNGRLNLEPLIKDGSPPVLEPHTSDWFNTSVLPYEYNPAALCPMWLKFLDECLESDPQRIMLLQEYFGYCCTSDTMFEKALFMEGLGGNGKSQAIQVLKRLVGQGNYESVPLENIGKQFQDYPMLGKLVNFSAETPARAVVNISALRQLISGDPYQFEKKYSDSFTAKPTAKLVISMNERPSFLDKSDALWRRMLLMPWNYKPPVPILDIGNKIADAEISGVLNWAIEGLRRLWANKQFTTSVVMEKSLANIRDENDPWRAELLEILVPSTEGFASNADIWSAHQRYRSSVESAPTDVEAATPRRLAVEVKRVFPFITPSKQTVNGTQVRGWSGVQLKEKT